MSTTTTRKLRCTPGSIRLGDVIRVGGLPVTVEVRDPWNDYAYLIEGWGADQDGTPCYVKVIVPDEASLTVEREERATVRG